MIIREMFKDDINRPINGVVKVDEDTERVLAQELDEYVITRELKKHFINFLLLFRGKLELKKPMV